MRIPPTLDRRIPRQTPMKGRALLINPFYPKDPHLALKACPDPFLGVDLHRRGDSRRVEYRVLG